MNTPAGVKLERLLNLTAALLATERLLPAAEIKAKVAGYADGKGAFRRTFERDKSDLRRMGIPITSGTVPASDPPVEGYRIHPRDYYLDDPDLTPDERAALHLASRTIRLEGASADSAFWALGGRPPQGDGAPELAVIPFNENLAALYRAIAERSVVSFGYRGMPRSVEPVRLQFARGHWYLGGHDRDRQAWRHFRLDRIDGIGIGPPKAFPPRPAVQEGLTRQPWEIGPEQFSATLQVDGAVASWVLGRLGPDTPGQQCEDGSVRLEVPVANGDALVDYVLGLLHHAVILDPPELRARLLHRVRAAAAAGWPETTGTSNDPPAATLTAVPEPARPPGEAPGRLTATERMHRLLQLIPWVAERDGAKLAEITERFDYPAERLLEDLQQVVFMVGVPPYTPDALIEVHVTDGWVQINFADYFRRPLRLTPPQAVALLAAATGLLGLTGDSALERGLAKLAAAVGVSGAEALEVNLGGPVTETLRTLQEACRSRRPAAIKYYSYDRDAVTERVIEPHRTFAHEGAWYVRSHCRLSGTERTFRVDRVTRVELLEERFDPPSEPVSATVWDPPAGSPWVELSLTGPGQWVLDHYPVSDVVREGETCRARLAVGGIAWLERLLLRLGPSGRVTACEGLPPDVVGRAARRILARYGE